MASAYVIELDGSKLYLRDHDDGAISWTGNPNKARRFGDDMLADDYARRRLSGNTIKVLLIDFGAWG